MNTLTFKENFGYDGLAFAKKASVGIDLPNSQGDTNTPKIVVNCVYFCVCNLIGRLRPSFMVGCIGATSVAPFPWDGKVNPVQLATHSLTSVSGEIISLLSKETAMSNLSVFDFKNNQVRVIYDDQINLLFVANDVGSALGYKNIKDALAKHCKGVAKHYPLETAGGVQEVRVINEPDLYRLIFGSKLKSAVQFQDWVFEDVLPTIRKTGEYKIPESPYITDEQLNHIKKGVGNRVRATGKPWQAVYRELYDYVGAPSVREIRKERYNLACHFLGIQAKFVVPADKEVLPKALPSHIADIHFDLRKDADYSVSVRNGKARRFEVGLFAVDGDKSQPWWRA